MNFRTFETKIQIFKYKFYFDMLRNISIILIPNMYLAFDEIINGFFRLWSFAA